MKSEQSVHKATCPKCKTTGTIFYHKGVVREGTFEIKGKIPSGHIMLYCDICGEDFKWDTLKVAPGMFIGKIIRKLFGK
ncbi:MAG: hypothetical protein ACE5DQ_00175 [Candidatus Paceibacterota bacterium]